LLRRDKKGQLNYMGWEKTGFCSAKEGGAENEKRKTRAEKKK